MTEQIKWSDAPDRTSWGASMRVADIEIDRDHTLTLFCEADQTAKVDAMFADAERYRYLRSRRAIEVLTGRGPGAGVWCDMENEMGTLVLVTGDDLDAEVDAARAALKETK
jgi:hypothetical protein